MKVDLGESGVAHSKIYDWKYPVYRRGEMIPIYIRGVEEDNLNSNKIGLKIITKTELIDDNDIVYTSNNQDKSKWCIQVYQLGVNGIKIDIKIPYNSKPGRYGIIIFHKKISIEKIRLLIFYNPWSPDDETFIVDEMERDEYVMNENTLIYYGTSSNIKSMNWNLGQFNKYTINVLLILLERIPKDALNKPNLLCRELTALVNFNDDNGILWGKWSGGYYGGTDPSVWDNSEEIMKKYCKTMKPVRYGQCWVFAAVLCSLCRCIGIPTRIVTNFNSLHDADGTLDREYYFDENMNEIDYLAIDSIWNFHVWNECYMSRDDVERKYHGWQILDATPQEPSQDRRYVCGPCPQLAVNRGDINVGHDTRFVFAEVNGDMIYKQRINGEFKVIYTRNNYIGKKISTKKIGSNERHDITLDYKYHNLSEMNFMIRKKVDSDGFYNETNNLGRVIISLDNKKNEIIMGDSLDYKVEIKTPINISTEKVIIRCSIVNFRGEKTHKFFSKEYTFETTEIFITESVPSDTILNYVTADISSILIELFILYNENIFQYESTSYNLVTPSFDLIYVEPLAYDVDNIITLSVYNPFPNIIEDVGIRLKSACFNQDYKKHIKSIDSKKTITCDFRVKPLKMGYYVITGVITSIGWPVFRETIAVSII